MKTCGVYSIYNTANGKMYIGSSKDIETRWAGHKHYLRGRNKEQPAHKNRHLQRDWDTHGEGLFELKILEKCSPDLLLEREQHYIDTLDNLYNVTDAIRVTLPEEMRQNISKGRIGIVFTEEHRKNLSEAHKGKTFDDYSEKQKVGFSNAVKQGKFKKKLTVEQAEEIRKLKAEGIHYKELMKMFSVSDRTIYDVVNGKYHKKGE